MRKIPNVLLHSLLQRIQVLRLIVKVETNFWFQVVALWSCNQFSGYLEILIQTIIGT